LVEPATITFEKSSGSLHAEVSGALSISGLSAGPARVLRMGQFLSGYLLAWAACGAVAFAVLAGSGRLLAVSPAAAKWLGVAIFAVAGAYQLSPWKGWCLRRCRSPLGALMM
jgi:predicted metal-binding membrane protein